MPSSSSSATGVVSTSHSAPPRAVTPPSTRASNGTTSPYSGRGEYEMSRSTLPSVQRTWRTSRCGTSTPSRWPPLSGPTASASTTTRVPVGVVNVVSKTSDWSRWRRELVQAPRGCRRQCPALSSSSRPKTDGLSNRGKHSHSTDPPWSTSAQEWRSEMRAWSEIRVSDMATTPIDTDAVAVADDYSSVTRTSRLQCAEDAYAYRHRSDT